MLPLSWTQDQLFFFNQLTNTTGDIWLAGLPGTGKTTAFIEARKRLEGAGDRVALLAPTGIAAQQIDGCTLARFLNIKTSTNSIAIGRLLEEDDNLIYKIRQQLQGIDVIMIDEISMVGLDLFMATDRLFKVAVGSEENPHHLPFGGKRLLVSGDFFQLPPVKDYHCFYHPAFPEPIELRQVMRQTNITDMAILTDLRKGYITPQVSFWINQSVNRLLPALVTPLHLYPHNQAVDIANQNGLKALAGRVVTFNASFEGFAKFPKSDVIIPEILELKVGAPVMLCVNGDNYQNGSQGKILQIDQYNKAVHVELASGETIIVGETEWNIRGGTGKIIGKVTGLPLKLAWAITVHKSQGQTLDYVRSDLTRSWAPGLAYVALTRTRSLNNIKLDGVPTNLAPDPKVVEFYKRKGL